MNMLISFASWEDRFRLGWERDLQQYDIKHTLLYYFRSYSDWTRHSRGFVEKLCHDKKKTLESVALDIERPAETWQKIQKVLEDKIQPGDKVLIDISTMPREIIWTLFWTVGRLQADVKYTYHRPQEYNKVWLSRDPGRARFVYKMGGVSKIDARTALVVTAGYDLQRVRQLYRWFEPERMYVGLQAGKPFRDNERRMKECKVELENESSIRFFEIDAYSPSRGKHAILEASKDVLGTHNVIASSLGPKLTAVAIYQLHLERPEVGLAYAPSNEFNREYSHGIGETFGGVIASRRVNS